MKFHLVALTLLFSLVLASCYSSGDITPPPDYTSPTPELTQVPATETSAPTRTSELSTPTSESTPATPEAATSTVDLSVTPADVTSTPTPPVIYHGSITGSVTNGSGGGIPAGQKIQLASFEKDASGGYQQVLDLEMTVKSDGAFTFTDVEMAVGRAFFVVVEFGGVQYASDPILVVDDTSFDFSNIAVTVYDTTDDLTALRSDTVKIYLIFDTEGVVQVYQEYRLTNPGSQTMIVATDGSSIPPFLGIPDGASGSAFDFTNDSSTLLRAPNGFAMIPGVDKQYGFVVSFTLPYTNRLIFSQPFTQPVTALDVYVENGISVKSRQLTKTDPETIQGIVFNHYQASNLPAATSLSMTLSGKLGASTGFQFDRQTIVMIGVGVVGLLFIGLGIFLFLHDRARAREEDEDIGEEDDENPDASGDDPNSILDAIIALDDQYENGDIPKEAYKKRRADLKKRLKK